MSQTRGSSIGSRPDYGGVTETPGTQISDHAASMARSRYDLVRRLAANKRVLEVACGSGQGLGLVAGAPAKVIGGDVMASLVLQAKTHYGDRIPLTRFDAHALPFADQAFDIVQIQEAIYYMAEPLRVFEECRRVLSADGLLVVSTINPSWPDFNPSPHSEAYFTASELKAALQKSFSEVEVLFGFPVGNQGTFASCVSLAKRVAVRLKLIPKTMGGKTLLKRLFFGQLVSVPPELTDGFAKLDEPLSLPLEKSKSFRVIYAIARR